MPKPEEQPVMSQTSDESGSVVALLAILIMGSESVMVDVVN